MSSNAPPGLAGQGQGGVRQATESPWHAVRSAAQAIVQERDFGHSFSGARDTVIRGGMLLGVRESPSFGAILGVFGIADPLVSARFNSLACIGFVLCTVGLIILGVVVISGVTKPWALLPHHLLKGDEGDNDDISKHYLMELEERMEGLITDVEHKSYEVHLTQPRP